MDGLTASVDKSREKRDAVTSFFTGDIASAGTFNDFWGDNLDSGISLPWHPKTDSGFEIIRKNGD